MEEAQGGMFKVDFASVNMYNAAAEYQYQWSVVVCFMSHFPAMKVIDFGLLEVNNVDKGAH